MMTNKRFIGSKKGFIHLNRERIMNGILNENKLFYAISRKENRAPKIYAKNFKKKCVTQRLNFTNFTSKTPS